MQCTSFTPVYYHARDVNLGANGYSWHLYDSNASYGDGGYNISMPLCNQYSVYDKEVLKQMIQNHEATFRFQVQELHRLYRRQRDLMDETRVREMFAHHLLSRQSESFHSLSRAGAEFSQNHSPASNWLFGNLASNKLSELTSGNVQGCKSLFAEKLEENTTLRSNNVQFLSPVCKQTGTEPVNLEQRKQFQMGNHSEVSELKRCSLKEISSFQPDFASIKTWDFSSSGSNLRKTNCFIDLNEPIQLDPLEVFTGHDKMVFSNERVPVEAIPEFVVPTQSQLLKRDDSSKDGVNSSMAIDLNSMPVNCYYETDMTLESPRSEDELKKSDNFLKTEAHIDLNTDLEGKHSLPLSTLQTKPAQDTELKGPVSPDNEESSPPRGKSEDIQLSSEQGEGEPFIEVDAIAAQTLLNMVANFRDLYWFAEFVSSTGDDLENTIMEFENDQRVENALKSSRFSKAKGTGTMPRRAVKGQKRGKKRECLKTSQVKRKASKNGCAKPRKYSKLSPSEVTKKSMSSILKQSAASVEQGFLQSWGKTRKREGGRKRRVSNSFLLAELASF